MNNPETLTLTILVLGMVVVIIIAITLICFMCASINKSERLSKEYNELINKKFDNRFKTNNQGKK